jgi:hypothetical protein
VGFDRGLTTVTARSSESETAAVRIIDRRRAGANADPDIQVLGLAVRASEVGQDVLGECCRDKTNTTNQCAVRKCSRSFSRKIPEK